MRVYYCKKCKKDSPTPVCEHCGQPLSAAPGAERYLWFRIHTPLGDARLVGRMLLRILVWAVILLSVLLLGEIAFEQNKAMALAMLLMGGLLQQLLIGLGIAIGLGLILLGLQGREELHYVVDTRGAYLQIWIEPTRLKCLSRMIRYAPERFMKDAQGSAKLLVSETHLLWNDVARYDIDARGGRILLYRPERYLFLTLWLEEADAEGIARLVAHKVRQGNGPAK